MKKIIFLLSILISFTAHSQCTLTGVTNSKTVNACNENVSGVSTLNTIDADTISATSLIIKYGKLYHYNAAHSFYTSVVSSPTANRIITYPDASGTVALTSDLGGYVKLITGAIQYDYPSTDEVVISTDNGVLGRTYMYLTPFNGILGYAGSNYFNCSPTDASLYATAPGSIIGLISAANVEMSTGSGYSFQLNTGSNFSALIETDNITGSDKTFQQPNASGTYVLNDNTAALINKTYNGVTLSGSSSPALAVTGTTTISGINTGDQPSLTPTAVKTTTYSAAANDFVPCNTTSGSFTITLPNAPADKTLFGAKMVIQGGSNTITINCAGSDVFNKAGGSTSGTISYLNQCYIFQYKSSSAIWYLIADDLPKTALDAIYQPLTTNLNHWSSIDTSAKANVNAQNITKTGGGSTYVMQNTPTLTTPNIGVATATSVNKVAITAPASGATITLADGSIFQLSGAFLTNLIATAATTATLPTGTYTIAKTADIQTFTSNGTWTKPTGAKSCFVLCIGPGGGGGSGRKSASLTLATGGGGGGSGGAAMMTFPAADLTATVAVVVSAGGTGAPSQTTNSTDGTAGGQGSSSSAFGGYLQGTRAGAGAGGTALGAAAGGTASTCMYNGQVGGASSATGGIGANGGNPSYSGTSGGAGGGITTLAAPAAGGNGGVFNAIPGSTAAAGGAVNTNGTAGTAYEYCGTGGGGGGGSTTTNAGSGGNGANYGSGGGGGGASLDGVGNSGAGGNGGGGLVVVITYF